MTIPQAESSPPLADEEATAARPKLAAAAALALFFAWLLALLGIVVATANPPIVNWRQIDESDAVVTGEPNPADPRQVRVTRVWKGRVGDTFELSALPESELPPGELIFPLQRDRGGQWAITPIRRKNRQLLRVYRADPATIEQLRRRLEEPIPIQQPTGSLQPAPAQQIPHDPPSP